MMKKIIVVVLLMVVTTVFFALAIAGGEKGDAKVTQTVEKASQCDYSKTSGATRGMKSGTKSSCEVKGARMTKSSCGIEKKAQAVKKSVKRGAVVPAAVARASEKNSGNAVRENGAPKASLDKK